MDAWEAALDDFESNVEAIEQALEAVETSTAPTGPVEQRPLQAPRDPLPMAWAARADELLGRAVAAQQKLEAVLASAAEPRRRATRVAASHLGSFDRSL